MASEEFVEEFDTSDEEVVEATSESASSDLVIENASTYTYNTGWGMMDSVTPGIGPFPNQPTIYPCSSFSNWNYHVNYTPSLGHYDDYATLNPDWSMISSQESEMFPSLSVDKQPEVDQNKLKKRNKRKKLIKLSDYEESERKLGWRKYLEKSLSKAMDEETRREINDKLKPLQMNDLTPSEGGTESDHSTLSKVLYKIEAQRRKRLREKLRKQRITQEKHKESKLLEERRQKIESWLTDQRDQNEIEIREKEVITSAKKSLFEIAKKKEGISQRLELLLSLQKLRSLRMKQIINTKKATICSQSERGFIRRIRELTKRAEVNLKEVSEEENMIRLMINDWEEKMCARSAQSTQKESESKDADQRDNNEVDFAKDPRQRKWQKWLAKRYYKNQHSFFVEKMF